VPATPVTTVKPVAPPAGAQPPAVVVAELSPWMVHSMERLRSMGPATAG